MWFFAVVSSADYINKAESNSQILFFSYNNYKIYFSLGEKNKNVCSGEKK